MSTEPSNEQRLRDAGVIVSDDLPAEFSAVAAGLTSDELDTIVSVKKRLDEANRVSGDDIGAHWIAP
jgi:hypothetical protein